jgi:hypothetical protein
MSMEPKISEERTGMGIVSSRFSVAFVSSVQKSLPLLLFRQGANGMIHCQSEVSEMSYKVINFSEKFGLIDEQVRDQPNESENQNPRLTA